MDVAGPSNVQTERREEAKPTSLAQLNTAVREPGPFSPRGRESTRDDDA